MSLPLALAWAYWLLRRRPSRLLPPPRRRAVPWEGLQVLALVFAVLFVCPTLVDVVLRATPFLPRLYGNDFFDALNRGDDAAKARYAVWSKVVTFPLQLAAVVALMKFCNARLYQLGLTGRRVGRDVLLGVLGFCALTPFVRACHGVVASLWREYVTLPVPHALEQISRTRPHLLDWALIFSSAVLLAPVLEELLFRGILQQWFTSRPRGGDIAVGSALGLSAFAVGEPAYRAAGLRELLMATAPLLFALATVPVYLLLRWRCRSAAVNGIFGTALLFGVAHAQVWPTPVALFLLGIGLGLLYYRTQSLVPPIVMHALFNVVSFGELLIQAAKRAKGQ